MHRRVRAALAALIAPVFADVRAQPPVATPQLHGVLRERLTAQYHAEGAGVGDFDRDGHLDVVYGPLWFRGPKFDQRHEIRAPRSFPVLGYADSFLSFGHDVDRDGWDDVVAIGFPGTAAQWYRNPQRTGVHWQAHVVHAAVDLESPAFVDLVGDARPELVCATGGRLGWLEPDPGDATRAWIFHPISAPSPWWNAFTHGFGVGDVDGDGRTDVLTLLGWFEQPASLAGDPEWTPHPFRFGAQQGGAQMFAIDVDGDGDADVVTSLNAHGYGLSWFEQRRNAQGAITFVEHAILPPSPTNPGGPQFSQLHALAVADMNGDALPDLVTGKCWLAHNGSDPGAGDPAVLFWFELQRGSGGARFVPHLLDSDSGVGRQVTIADLDGDGRPDVVSGNKKGCSVFLRGD